MTGIHLNGDAWIVLAIFFAVLVVALFASGRRSS
jgi:hypothetical protein